MNKSTTDNHKQELKDFTKISIEWK